MLYGNIIYIMGYLSVLLSLFMTADYSLVVYSNQSFITLDKVTIGILFIDILLSMILLFYFLRNAHKKANKGD